MICIYSKNNTDFDHNGDAVLIPTSCKLSATINGAWQLTLEHPYDPEERYKYIIEGSIIVADIRFIRELGTTRQKFRIYNYVKGLHSVTAIAFPIAMESTYDAPIDNLIISGKTGAQAMALLQAKTNKYTLSTDITKTGYTSFSNTNINSAIASGDEGSFIDVWGGEILYDNLNYSVKSRLGDNVASSHKVTYGNNLTSIEYKKDDSGLITRIYPISQDGIRLNGSGYVDSPKVSDYPVPHSRFMTAPYNLVDSDSSHGTQTSALTQTAVSAVSSQASSLSQSVYNTQISNGYQPEYIKTIKDSIISAVQTMALANVVSTSLYNLMASTIKSAMDWMKDLKQPKWDWMGSYESGWRYGNSTSYAKNMYVKISKTWSYFGSNGYWQEPRDNSNEWDWYQKNSSSGKKYGDFTKYYAHNEYVYITRNGTIYEYWFNEDGWYEDDESGESDYYWHGSGTSGDPYWFGDGNGNYLKSCWRFIDGDYCFFDSFGYCAWDSNTRRQNWPWDWNDGGSADRSWFGNPNNKEMGAEYLFSQWAKINGSWYYFDANGYVETEAASETRTVAAYTTGMAGLQTTVDNYKSQLYTLLYSLMTAYANKQYAEGVDVPVITITVKMADLKNTTEYADFKHLEEIKLGDSVLCTDAEHDITTENRIVGIVYDILRDYNETITIGSAAATVQQMVGNAGGEAVSGGFDTTAIESQLTALRNGKQDKLTAGDHITISGNVISADVGEGIDVLYGPTAPNNSSGNNKDFYLRVNSSERGTLDDEHYTHTTIDLESFALVDGKYDIDLSGYPESSSDNICFLVSGLEYGEDYKVTFDLQYDSDTIFDYGDYGNWSMIFNTANPYTGYYEIDPTRTDAVAFEKNTNLQHCSYVFTAANDNYICFAFQSVRDFRTFGVSISNLVIETNDGGSGIKEIYNKNNGVWLKYEGPYVIDNEYVHTDNNFTDAEKTKLLGIASGAEVNVQANWTESDSSSDAYIQNKPNLATVATSGSYNDLSNRPSIPEVEANPSGSATETLTKLDVGGTIYEISGGGGTQVQSDWTQTDSSAVDYIKNKPTLATVATSGAYSDLSGTPTLATVATTGDYDDLLDKPNLATVATSGSYNDLTNKPNLSTVATSGSYNDLSNKPTIPSVEANPSGSGSTDLTKLEVDGTIYNIPSGGGSSLPLVVQNGKLCIVYET